MALIVALFLMTELGSPEQPTLEPKLMTLKNSLISKQSYVIVVVNCTLTSGDNYTFRFEAFFWV